jgi:hypothetical protein
MNQIFILNLKKAESGGDILKNNLKKLIKNLGEKDGAEFKE